MVGWILEECLAGPAHELVGGVRGKPGGGAPVREGGVSSRHHFLVVRGTLFLVAKKRRYAELSRWLNGTCLGPNFSLYVGNINIDSMILSLTILCVSTLIYMFWTIRSSSWTGQVVYGAGPFTRQLFIGYLGEVGQILKLHDPVYDNWGFLSNSCFFFLDACVGEPSGNGRQVVWI